MRTIAILSLCVLASCSEAEADSTDPSAGDHAAAGSGAHKSTDPICDGSDALRFGWTVSAGGQVPPGYEFSHPFGHEIFAIDGKCHYYAVGDYMRGVFSGTLSSEDVAQLAEDVHWDELDSWADKGVVNRTSCFDAGGEAILSSSVAVGCACGCDGGPPGLENAISKTSEWLHKLTTQGEPLHGPVSAVVIDTVFSKAADQPVFDWPLSTPINAIPDLKLDRTVKRVSLSEPYARFEEAADYTKLRELRTMTVEKVGEKADTILLRNGMLENSLFVRDEPPAEFVDAWKEFVAMKR